MTLLQRLDALCDELTVLRHPFYRRWERGELSRAQLAYYAGEYRHAVEALADVATAAAPAEHAAEERAHVRLWDAFAHALDGELDRAPRGETSACVEAWRDPAEPLGVLYAVESTQPPIAETKRDGLTRFYGFAPGSAATAYFDVHAERDLEHAAETRARLEHVPDERHDAILESAERALRGNWTLLDGVERAIAAAA